MGISSLEASERLLCLWPASQELFPLQAVLSSSMFSPLTSGSSPEDFPQVPVSGVWALLAPGQRQHVVAGLPTAYCQGQSCG